VPVSERRKKRGLVTASSVLPRNHGAGSKSRWARTGAVIVCAAQHNAQQS